MEKEEGREEKEKRERERRCQVCFITTYYHGNQSIFWEKSINPSW
jgi:hypothetical protein